MFGRILEILMIYLFGTTLALGGGLVFVEKVREVTTKPDVELVEVEFEFENKGDKTVAIVNYDAPCSCMEASLKRKDGKRSMEFAPGEKGTVVGILDFGTFKGTIDKVIRVRTDEGDAAVVLTCRVTIPALIATDQVRLSWEVGSKLESKEFRIKVAKESVTPIHVVRHEYGYGTGDFFAYKLEEVEKGREYKVTVTPLKTGKPTMGVVKFYTDSKIGRFKLVQIFLLVDYSGGKEKGKGKGGG